ncbi:MAG: hypothetical protein CL693_20090 [Cellvibrionaceae bacterium]|nr:hypothetical protein [Cellvibrionaceae bacterium]
MTTYLWRLFVLSLLLCASAQAEVEKSTCTLEISLWHTGRPFLYQVGTAQEGIFPELLAEIFDAIPCEIEIAYIPAARIKAKASQRQSDISIAFRPFGTDYFLGNPEYSSIEGMGSKSHREKIQHKLIATPILYPSMAFIGRKDKRHELESQEELLKLKLGSINVPQKNVKFWRDFIHIPKSPIGYRSPLQGLKAVASGRIDLFVFYSASIQDFDNTNVLRIVKSIEPFELRLIVHERGLGKITDEEIRILNKQIQRLHNNGSLQRIIEKHSNTQYFYQPTPSKSTELGVSKQVNRD